MTLRDNFRDRGYHISSEKRTQENLIFNDFVPCWSQRSVPEVLHAKHSFEWKNARWQFFFSQQGGLSGMKLFGNCRVWNHLCQLLAWIFFPKSVAALLRSARKKWIRNSHVKSTGGRVGCCHCQEKLDEIGQKTRRKNRNAKQKQKHVRVSKFR